MRKSIRCRFFTILMVMILAFSSTAVYAESDIIEPVEVENRAQYKISQTRVIAEDNDHKVNVTVYFTKRDAAELSSGFYITGVTSVTASNKKGWVSVQSKASIKSVTYSTQHQKAYVTVTYSASMGGSGYHDYEGTVTISA